MSPVTSDGDMRKAIAKRTQQGENKNSLGFLKRLEEEGHNVKINAELNEILFLDDEKRAAIEKLEEENQKKSRKPRPRDIFDYEGVKRLNVRKELEEAERAEKEMEDKLN
jgi:hypothetical protein